MESQYNDRETCHVPVMLDEVLKYLAPQSGMVLVDGTLGGAGHTRKLAELVSPAGRIVAFDRDLGAVQRAQATLANLPVDVVHASYEEIPEHLGALGIPHVDGVLLDLGLSSDQLEDSPRGFSFRSDGPLDMRFDTTQGESAAELLARVGERELADIIYEYGEERFSRRIARQIVACRQRDPVKTSQQLADIVRRSVPFRGHSRLDPATRTFQAIRIAVNDELGGLQRAIERIPGCLKAGGRLVVISFHSLEDRIVKSAFRSDPRFAIITRKPLRPGNEEVEHNLRARSAKLRVAERTAETNRA